jgi:hypothetical protein
MLILSWKYEDDIYSNCIPYSYDLITHTTDISQKWLFLNHMWNCKHNRKSSKLVFQMSLQVEMMRGLVQLAVEKLHSELPHLQYDDTLFSHTVDETLGFNHELRESYRYPSSQPGVIGVLTQARIFVKWIYMEKKCKLQWHVTISCLIIG